MALIYSSHRLSFDDAVQIWHLRWAGEIQSRIAAFFDVNQGRISEVLRGKRHPGSEAEARRRASAATSHAG